ncbi:type I-E CRISPR-associated protein Cse1/CasA [Streptomyces violaceusniger]|uniref:type I-E CRISPR-associated protein Cse1/CasA n=1 Tax=Streptomyces violaceusniger TaxID=68280 RepID=UPI0036BC79E3
MPSPPAYPVDLRPCIPVHMAGRHQALGLREVLIQAHRIDDLALPLPPAHSALLRLLTAITAELTGLDDANLSLEEWHERRTDLLTSGRGLKAQDVHDYCDASALDLYNPHRPLLQDPRLAAQCTKTSGINKLVFGRPAGNNLAWLSPHTDIAPHPVPSDEAFWHLLIQHYYGAAGRCTTRSAGPHTSGRATAAPLRSTLSFHPQGATLLETLLLHQFPYRGGPQHAPDTCPWQEPEPPDPVNPPPPVTWPKRLLTGRSRHAVLLVPNADGSAATDAYLTWATQHPAYPATDPYLIIDTHTRAKAEQRDSPRRADADRALWRDLDALLLAGDESSTQRRPAVFDTLNDLPAPVRARLRVRVCGFDQDGRTTNSIWYTALTPPLWNWAEEHDPPAARRIAACRQAAEHLAALLRTHANTAWSETQTPTTGGAPPAPRRGHRSSRWAREALALYWPRAEQAFWNLVNHNADEASDPYPVFARTATDVLRQAVRPDLARHQAAGPALARAVRALNAAAAPASRRKKAARHAQP